MAKIDEFFPALASPSHHFLFASLTDVSGAFHLQSWRVSKKETSKKLQSDF
jgi:hypothetical protein